MPVETATERGALLADFGTTATYGPLFGEQKSITVIFDNGYQAVDAGGTVAFAVSQPKIICRTADIVDAEEGDKIVHDNITYTISVIMSDGTGMSEIMLEAS